MIQSRYLDHVNILQGTDSTWRFSRGNTLPLTQRPFSMAAFAPQITGTETWWFTPNSRMAEGVRLTHQPSPWIGDYGTVMFVPQADVFQDLFYETWTGLCPEQTLMTPDMLRLGFRRSCSTLELVPNHRGAAVRVRFDTEMPTCVSFFNMMGKGGFTLDPELGELRGWTDGFKAGVAKDFKMYITVRPRGGWVDWEASRTGCQGEKGAFVHLALKKGVSEAEFGIGISYIGYDFARRSAMEGYDLTLEQLQLEAATEWENYLGSIRIEADEEEKDTFYSCLYRTGTFPHAAFEPDEHDQPLHYSPYTGTVEKGVRYVGHGFWDTFRTLLPLFRLIRPQLYRDIVLSALSDYREGGWLPRWLAPGEVGCMPSTLIDSVLAQGATSGILSGEEMERCLEAMEHHANHAAPSKIYGRTGILEYLRYGYVPCDLYKESVNLTVDFAHGDYCIAKIAEKLGQTEKAEAYFARSHNWKHLLDPKTRFMRPKATDGKFKEPFDPISWDEDFTEGSSWQSTFAPQHDIPGLAEAMGGREALLEQLDAMFAERRPGRVGTRGIEIHEMTEMNAEPYGHCSINNQPSNHIPYIYSVFGQPQKTLYWVGRICDEQFRATLDGFPGDEDNGSMGSWYVLSRLGLYPMCPADDTWIKLPAAVEGTILGENIETFKEGLAQMPVLVV